MNNTAAPSPNGREFVSGRRKTLRRAPPTSIEDEDERPSDPDPTQRESSVPDPIKPAAIELSETLFADSLLRVEQTTVRNAATLDSQLAVRIIAAHESIHRMVVVPTLYNGRSVLVGRYRWAVGRWSLEFPSFWATTSDAGWAQAAAEGLAREAGLRAATMRLLGAIEADPTLMAINTLVVAADGCEATTAGRIDPPNLIAGSAALTAEEIDGLMARGEIFCGTTLSAICLTRLRRV